MWDLKNSSNKNCKAEDFKEIMGQKNSLFLGMKAGDAKDLFFNLIDSLIEELQLKKGDEGKIVISDVNINDKQLIFEETKRETDTQKILTFRNFQFFQQRKVLFQK